MQTADDRLGDPQHGEQESDDEMARHRQPSLFWRVITYGVALFTVALVVHQSLNLQLFGILLIDNRYMYTLSGPLLASVFIYVPFREASPRDFVPWYDIVIILTVCACSGYLAYQAEAILDNGWELGAPPRVIAVCAVLWILAIEAARRTGGYVIALVILVFSIYPLYADHVPFPFSGLPYDFEDAAAYHVLSRESIFGIPMQAFANLVVGFIVFGTALQYSGAGRFFINLAFALFGHVRGGAAKVGIFSSALLGSVSGSVITNIVTTGSFTIPAMKRSGFTPRFAGGVEACASTGGVLMPPVMGATAFVMASFLGVPYLTVAAAATVPAILYFFGLFVQIDAYAARNGLAGLPRSELPTLGSALREGWHYLIVFAYLFWMLAVVQNEVMAPFYATALLLIVNQTRRLSRWNLADLSRFLVSTTRILAELTGLLAGVGLIVGAFSMTGLSATLSVDLVYAAGGNAYVILLMGAVTSFILGMGMTATSAYIFLAVILAPALVQSGFDRMAVHLFLLYWGMLSFITPPVAIGAFAAASVARADPMRTGLEAMRLGAIVYFIPFFFVLNPALILHGAVWEIAFVFLTSIAGIVLICGALQGYIVFIGSISTGYTGAISRIALAVSGMALAIPVVDKIYFIPVSIISLISIAFTYLFALNTTIQDASGKSSVA